jgi:hypothetical protein
MLEVPADACDGGGGCSLEHTLPWSSRHTLSPVLKPNLHEIGVSLFSLQGKRNLERRLAQSDPVLVAAGILLKQRFQFFDFMHAVLI